MNKWLCILGFWLSATSAAFGLNTKARLALADATVRPGNTVLAGVVLEMNPPWHTYWRNPGESGMATTIKWNLPNGVKAGPIQWPLPDYYDSEGLVTYVLRDTAVLLVPLKFPAGLKPGSVTIEAKVSWLECEALCLPGDATVHATITVTNETTASQDAGLIARAESMLPKEGAALEARAGWEGPPQKDKRALIIEWPATGATSNVNFFPYAADNYEIQPQVERMPVDRSRVSLRAVVKKFEGDWPKAVGGVIVLKRGNITEAYKVQLTIAEQEPVTPETGGANSAPAGSVNRRGIALNLLLAFAGGLILNLMPCVLPILSLKVLSLIQQASGSAGERRRQGVIYSVGVLVSFWVISGLVIAGRLASWGAQFQDPRFVVVVTVLMTLVALNLFGVFEVLLPGSAVTGATQLASKSGDAGAFFNGILAVVLGASCVAPLLAAAVGWAISQPPLVIVLIFTMIGFGLASPFLALSFFPALQKWLPKPGPWMQKFKVAMGFPMMATAAWLLSQTADHFGAAGPLWVGLFLVCLALALWIYGEFVQRGRGRKTLAFVFVILFAGGGYVFALEQELDWRHPPKIVPGQMTSGERNPGNGIPWQPWSPAAVEAARDEGRPVLVDFTANWCLTCKLNEKTSLEIDPVRQKLDEINAVALKGDYTRQDPAITAELKHFESAGVPLVLVYPREATKPPVKLPTVLTPSIVLKALNAAAQ